MQNRKNETVVEYFQEAQLFAGAIVNFLLKST